MQELFPRAVSYLHDQQSQRRTLPLGVIQERMPPGTSEVRHLHRRARQFFFVLAGRASFELDGEEIELGPGEGLEIEPGTPHQIANRGREDLEFLVISQPHAHGDRVVL